MAGSEDWRRRGESEDDGASKRWPRTPEGAEVIEEEARSFHAATRSQVETNAAKAAWKPAQRSAARRNVRTVRLPVLVSCFIVPVWVIPGPSALDSRGSAFLTYP